MTTAVKRACDACHRRKVKCDGVNPCRNCAASQLSCTYNAIPQKKGPKGSRAKVISELRETQRHTSLSAKVHSVMSGVPSPPYASPLLAPTPGLLSSDMVRDSIDFFFVHMYPIMPVLQRQRLEQQALYLDQNLDAYCVLTSMCALMVLQPGMSLPGGDGYALDSMPGAHIVSATLLVEETIRARKGFDYLEAPTLNTILTSYFLFACHYAIDMHAKAWYHLREATTLVHMVGMHKEETYMQWDTVEAARRRRLYWLLFVTERIYALQRNRPLSLQATVNPPSVTDDPTDPLAANLTNFLAQVNMFRPFDDAFVALWNKTRGECSQALLMNLQKRLQEVLPPYLNDEHRQISELQMDQSYLKNLNWSFNLACAHDGSFDCPIDVSRDLLPLASHLPNGRLGLQGMNYLERLTAITCSLTEYLAAQPPSRDPFTVGPRQQLHQLLNVVTLLRSGDNRFLPLLIGKVADLLPKQITPMLQNAPESTSVCNVDIFDGFGNAGMGQSASYAGEEYDNKLAIPRIEDVSPNSGGSSGSAANNDITSPFVSSPAVMSPCVEGPHGLLSRNMQPNYGSSSMSSSGTMNNNQAQPQQRHHQHQHQHQHQHRQRSSASHFQDFNAPMANLNAGAAGQPLNLSVATHNLNLNHNMGSGMSSGINAVLNSPVTIGGSNLMPRQPLQRSGSFAVPPSQMQTMGDFHAVQRANNDVNSMGPLNVGAVGADLGFGTSATRM